MSNKKKLAGLVWKIGNGVTAALLGLVFAVMVGASTYAALEIIATVIRHFQITWNILTALAAIFLVLRWADKNRLSKLEERKEYDENSQKK